MAKKTPPIKRIAKQLAAELRKLRIPVNRIVLFGSYASKKSRVDSDIDLAIISPRFHRLGILARQELIASALMHLEFSYPIEVIAYPQSHYRHPPEGTLLSEIKNKGITVYQSR